MGISQFDIEMAKSSLIEENQSATNVHNRTIMVGIPRIEGDIKNSKELPTQNATQARNIPTTSYPQFVLSNKSAAHNDLSIQSVQSRISNSKNPNAFTVTSNTSITSLNALRLRRQLLDPTRRIGGKIRGVVDKNIISFIQRSASSQEDFRQELDIDYHYVEWDELLKRFDCDLNKGLSAERAQALLIQNGPNYLTPPPKTPEWIKLIRQFVQGFSLLLLAGSVLCIVAYLILYFTISNAPKDNLFLGLVLAFVVLITGLFSYYQEAKSSHIMESFKKMLPQKAIVIRDGQRIEIKVENIVIGDIVEVDTGDRIPADIRIIKSQGFKVDNSSLTGESEPQSRSADLTSLNPLETKNLAFFSTYVAEGNAKGLVVTTGDATLMGRIANLAAAVEIDETPIHKEVRRFVTIIALIAVVFGVAFFFISYDIGYTLIDAIIFSIGIIAANVPEGLLPTITVCLTLTAKRMASKNCLVKNIETVETLGSTSIICSDKTGTLTQNKMTVSHLWFNRKIYTQNLNDEDDILQSATWRALSRISMLCNKSTFEANQEKVPIIQRKCMGNASEVAILKFMETHVGDACKYRDENPSVADIPFNSTNKYQLSIHDIKADDSENHRQYLLVMKGAPEKILDLCNTALIEGQENGQPLEVPVTEEFRREFNEAYVLLGGMGERVLGFCDLKLSTDQFPPDFTFDTEKYNFPAQGYRFAGLISMIDPPRVGVQDAILKCRKAGIKVAMVTGDHPLTSKAIANQVGIITCDTIMDRLVNKHGAYSDGFKAFLNSPNLAFQNIRAAIIHGQELKTLADPDLDQILEHFQEIVFARISPQQKLKIVESYQRLGQIVAVTGDGVNDAPALKAADIGVSMGIAGSDVSKQAADMVLLDDNFATIVTGIEQGRLIQENLKKSIAYTLTHTIPEIAPFLSYVLFSIPLPMATTVILCIDLGTDIGPAISYAYENAETDIMNLKPRVVHEKFMNSRLVGGCYGQMGVVTALAGFFNYLVVMAENGFLPERLLNIRPEWDSQSINDLRDSFGQEWTYENRKLLEKTCYSAFFVGVVICQFANLIIRKTRRKSIFQHGMWNWALNFSLFFEFALTCFLLYTPEFNYALGFQPLKVIWWLPPIPFSLYIVMYDELRKYYMRKHPGGWIEQETYF